MLDNGSPMIMSATIVTERNAGPRKSHGPQPRTSAMWGSSVSHALPRPGVPVWMVYTVVALLGLHAVCTTVDAACTTPSRLAWGPPPQNAASGAVLRPFSVLIVDANGDLCDTASLPVIITAPVRSPVRPA